MGIDPFDRQTYEQKKAEHKRAVQEATVECLEKFKQGGVLKACPVCGKDHWSGLLVQISGVVCEDQYDAGGLFSLMGILEPGPPKTALTCLVVTCNTCTHMQFFNVGTTPAEFKKTLDSEETKQT